MIRSVRSHYRRSAAIAVVLGGLGLGGLWLVQGQTPPPVQAQESQPPPTGQTPESQTPDAAPRKVSAKPTGVVTAIADDRASFTFRTAAGEEKTVRVTERTVLTGGKDRPYNMSLLQVGDYVRLKMGGMKQKSPDAVKQPKNPNRAGVARKPGAGNAGGTPVARRVIVRPAADGPFKAGGKLDKGAKKNGADKKKGGLDGGASE